jgi:hypothetical protein
MSLLAFKRQQETIVASPRSPLLAENAPERAHPYFRFLLSSQSIPRQRLLPPEMDHLPKESWAAFWSRIKPHVDRLELLNTRCKVAALMIFIASFVVFVDYIPSIADGGSPFTAAFLPIFILVAIAGNAFGLRKIQAQLETIRAFCREEEKRVYRQYGFALECDCECIDNVSGLSYFYLYFLPGAAVAEEQRAAARNGYLRIEVFNSLLAGRGWNITLLPDLVSNEYLPNGFASLSHDDWAEVWSKLIEVSRECQSAMRLQIVTELPMLLSVFALYTLLILKYYTACCVIFIFGLLSMRFFLHAESRFRNSITKPPLIVAEYTAKFAQQGVYMEHRKLLKFHGCTGSYVHYVYLFPRTSIESRLLPEGGGSINRES